MSRALFVALTTVLAVCLPVTFAETTPGDYQKLVAFREAMLARPVHTNWTKALASWSCPTNVSNSFGDSSACDPCGREVWGNWDHIACRGAPITYTKDAVPGNGEVTNVHITDYKVEGEVPLKELCSFQSLREFDLDGGHLTGSVPSGFAQCFPKLREIDLSYNKLSGELPAEISQVKPLEQLKFEVNSITGTIPPEYASLKELNWLRFAKNKMHGSLPESFSATSEHLYQLLLDNNDFEGTLYSLAKHSMVSFSAHNNPKLCGMVPVGVRFAHGFNFYNTGLGLPCPDEIANGLK